MLTRTSLQKIARDYILEIVFIRIKRTSHYLWKNKTHSNLILLSTHKKVEISNLGGQISTQQFSLVKHPNGIPIQIHSYYSSWHYCSSFHKATLLDTSWGSHLLCLKNHPSSQWMITWREKIVLAISQLWKDDCIFLRYHSLNGYMIPAS